MTPANGKKLGVLLLIALCGFLFIRSQRFLSRAAASSGDMEKESDLYLPEVPYLKFLSLGHDGLMADLVLAKALTYYGSHYYQRRNFSFIHLKKLFFTAVQMDPMNKEAFLMANNTLSSVNIDDSIEILKLGMKYHPDYWKFPEMIGFNYFYHLKDPHRAARYYEQAARLPGHPPYVPSLSGKFYQESGRYEDALRVLYNFYSTTEDKRLKKSFKNYIEAVQEKIRLKQFQLTALISKVLDGQTVEFQPDADNPRFQFLKLVEILRLVGLKTYDIHSANEKEKLFAYFQWDYARLVLEGVSVRIEFERRPGGGLKRDKDGRYRGSVMLSDNRLYRYPANVPDVPDEIELKDILKNRRKIVWLRYRVARVEIGAENIYLHSGPAYRNPFSVVIPLEFIKGFSPVGDTNYFKSLTNRWIRVTGVAGLHDRQVRMNIYLPSQLAIL